MEEGKNGMLELTKFYKEKNTTVHITLHTGVWFNGHISNFKDDRLILIDDKLGEVLILFEKIKDIQPKLDKVEE